MDNISDMIANPEAYGFSWGYGPLHKGKMEVCALAPYMEHKDLARLREVFGDDYFLSSANGQSARVRDQLLRNDIWLSKPLASKPEEMKRIVLERALGTKSRRSRTITVEKIVEKEVRIYVADDGQEFTDKAEYMAYQVDLKLNA